MPFKRAQQSTADMFRTRPQTGLELTNLGQEKGAPPAPQMRAGGAPIVPLVYAWLPDLSRASAVL
jgi:hypothetical protein